MNEEAIASHVEQRTSRGIAAAVGKLIRSGQLQAGSRLPTVRSLAKVLVVSPATVASAWRILTLSHLIETRRKLGSVVKEYRDTQSRFRSIIAATNQQGVQDLGLAGPDPLLLPDLRRALQNAAADWTHVSYQGPPILPRLQEQLQPTWPFTPEAMVAVNSGFEAIQLVCETSLRYGDRIAVENPTAARILDILNHAGMEPVPIPCDDQGPIPAGVEAAIRSGVTAILIQPRAHEPCGYGLTPERAEALSRVLERHDIFIIEDDAKAALSVLPPVSLGTYLPGRTMLIRSFNKSHGVDLRVAVIGGAQVLIGPLWTKHILGAGWTSYIMQAALAYMLADEQSISAIEHARQTYQQRREQLALELKKVGITTANRDGLTLWIPVWNERDALLTLAAYGINVSPGSRFMLMPHPGVFIRVATSRLTSGYQEVAAAMEAAARLRQQTSGHV